MKYRRVGKTDLNVSAIGLGCGRLGSVTQAGGPQAALRLIGCALDAGVNFFDTADIYGQGASESLLAKALKGRREKVAIATKAGFCLSPLAYIARQVKPLLQRFIRARPGLSRSVQQVRATQNRQDFSASHLIRAVEASLRRLQTETLDIFMLHSPPTDVLQRGEVFQVLESLKSQGKLRHYGVSCRKASDAGCCLDQPGVSVLQLELNLFTPQTIGQVLPTARAKDVGVVARQALAGGVLLRAVAELRPEDCSSREEDFNNLKFRLQRLEQIAMQVGNTLPQLALQFLLQTNGISSVLIGTTSAEHFQAHLPVLERGALPEETMAAIVSAVHSGAVFGV